MGVSVTIHCDGRILTGEAATSSANAKTCAFLWSADSSSWRIHPYRTEESASESGGWVKATAKTWLEREGTAEAMYVHCTAKFYDEAKNLVDEGSTRLWVTGNM